MIRGTLDNLHLGDLLQWLQLGGISGRLSITSHGWKRHLNILKGRIVYASSEVPGERLGNWLASEGVASAAELRDHLARSLLGRKLFTLQLIDSGITAADLRHSVRRLANMIVGEVLRTHRARFVLDSTYPVGDLLALDLDLDAHNLLLNAAKKIDEDTHHPVGHGEMLVPIEGEAFERFFWQVLVDGFANEPIDGALVGELHKIVRRVTKTLARWLETSTGMVPWPHAALIGGQEGSAMPRRSLPHTAWNYLVFACSVRSTDVAPPKGLENLLATGDAMEIEDDIQRATHWHRGQAERLDEITPRVARDWAAAAAAAAPHLDVPPGTAALAAHLLTVPTDLVLWVLTSVPIPHRGVRQALLRKLPRRLGSGLGTRADFPEVFRSLLDGPSASPLAACLHLGRETLVSPAVWPDTVPEDHGLLLEAVPGSRLSAAAVAARDA
jgi:hypothetical protein